MGRKQQEPIRKVTLADGSTRWRCGVDVGQSRDGRRRQSTRTFATMKEAKAFVSSTRVLVTSGTYVAPAETGAVARGEASQHPPQDSRGLPHRDDTGD